MKRRRKIIKSVDDYVADVHNDEGLEKLPVPVIYSNLDCDSEECTSKLSDDDASRHSSDQNELLPDSDIDTAIALFSDTDEFEDVENADSSECAYAGRASEMEKQDTLETDLACWANSSGISRNNLTQLLKILNKNGISGLPTDARTLLKTPRNVAVADKCGGSYYYFGMSHVIEEYCVQQSVNDVQLLFNIDGLPLFNSTNVQFWPILCGIVTKVNKRFKPFVVALFCGDSKPSSLSGYLEEFLQELSVLCNCGITVENTVCSVSIKAFICDAPARSWLKCVKLHTGYDSCERCVVHGSYESSRVVLTDVSAAERNDEKFAKNVYADTHQEAVSPLTMLNVGLVSCFVLDYMHLICLGVTRRLIHFWVKGTKKLGRLSSTLINLISVDIVKLRGAMPSDFARKPRSIKDMERWKATEFRQFLLYVGPVVLKNHLPEAMYEHFLCLSIATSILLSDHRKPLVEYARQLLICFVQKSAALYGNAFVVYNVHSLIHVVDDVVNHSCTLNDISAFPFENYLHSLKKLVRSPNNPVAQIAKRLTETDYSGIIVEREVPELPALRTQDKDNCYLLTNGNVCFLREVNGDNSFEADILHRSHLQNWFRLPCESSKISIFSISNTYLKRLKRKIVTVQELSSKLLHLGVNKTVVFLPLVHQN